MATLNAICDQHEHMEGCPHRELRRHVLAVAIEAVEGVLAAHGYPDPTRAYEALHVAIGGRRRGHEYRRRRRGG